MKLLNRRARLTCKHFTGVVNVIRCQHFVFIEDSPVLRKNDPELEPVTGCTNVGATIKPCMLTLAASRGYSNLVFIEDEPVCLDTLTGLTDGTPPGIVEYDVRDPGQSFVSEE